MEENKTYEVCPHCAEEVELNAELMVQTCPNCGKRIVTCSMCRACDTEDNYCTHCCLCYQADKENEEALQEARESIHKKMITERRDTMYKQEKEELISTLRTIIENNGRDGAIVFDRWDLIFHPHAWGEEREESIREIWIESDGRVMTNTTFDDWGDGISSDTTDCSEFSNAEIKEIVELVRRGVADMA